jgi:tRNA(Ile)-lysidine synthetase-like protein
MTTIIRDFWLSHPEYWIALGPVQAIADKEIYTKFHDYDFTKEDAFGQVIYLDQFIRHFSRIEAVSEEFITKSRVHAASITKESNLIDVSESELIWYLMPWKHLGEFTDIFDAIELWLGGHNIVDFPVLNKFFMDTYQKAYGFDGVKKNVMLVDQGTAESYDIDTICESHPYSYGTLGWASLAVPIEATILNRALSLIKNTKVAISLSGGVDSMLMTRLLVAAKVDVVAIHIVYGNRNTSAAELAFISRFCKLLSVPLYIYKIMYLRRSSVERAFYEKVTRDIRFHVYRCVGRTVLMGHIQEDVVENIWTNFAKGNNLDNLAKFSTMSEESGVQICRPWLQIKKVLIYKVAEMLGVPHLKNTTPCWSNRGKFREHFYEATKSQYGEGVDDKILEVALRYKKQAELLDKLLFQTILNSWDEKMRSIDITMGVSLGLDGDGWQRIFTDLAHGHLGLTKPSFSACNDFAERVGRGLKDGLVIHFTKRFRVTVCRKKDKTLLMC